MEAYLFAGASVDHIQLSSLIPFGADSTLQLPDWSQIQPIVEYQGEEFPLSLIPGDTGRYAYDGNDLPIVEGESYLFSLEYNGETLRSTTLVPPKPAAPILSSNSIGRTQIDFSQGPGGLGPGQGNEDPLEISWDNPNADYYYILVENIESNPEAVILNPPFERNFSFVNEPTQNNIEFIEPRMLEFFGTHRVILYRVSEDYAALYENREQDSRSLNEPFSNIENGLGIFTALNSDTVYFELVKQ